MVPSDDDLAFALGTGSLPSIKLASALLMNKITIYFTAADIGSDMNALARSERIQGYQCSPTGLAAAAKIKTVVSFVFGENEGIMKWSPVRYCVNASCWPTRKAWRR